jgi:hypothetical protein
MGTPMVVDEGVVGLDQSRHHPSAFESAYAPRATLTGAEGATRSRDDGLDQLKLDIEGWVVPGKMEMVVEAVGRWATKREQDAPPTRQSTADAFLRVEIKKAVIEAVQELLPARPAQPALDLAKSWAKVAGGGRGLAATSTGDEPRRAVPARHPRELIVKAPNKAPEMAGRTAQQIVDATNAAIGTKEAVATQRLRSGNVVLTFKEDPGETAKRDDWV